MKKGTVFVLLAFCCITVYAQKVYDSILKEGKVWWMEVKPVLNPEYGEVYDDELIMLQGDTLIDDIPFKRVYKKQWIRGEEEPAEWKETSQFVGEKDGKIYNWDERPSTSSKKQMVMDFTLHVGDDFACPMSDRAFIVKNVRDMISFRSSDNYPHHSLSLFEKRKSEDLLSSDTWIEGIGSIKGGLLGVEGVTLMGAWYRLVRCEDNGVCIYNAEEMTDNTPHVQKEYESLLEEGKVWKMEYKTALLPECEEQYSYKDIVMQGDTVINDIHFKKAQDFWIGQKGGIVYQYSVDEEYGEQCLPIMDFSLNVGDIFEVRLKETIMWDEMRKMIPDKFRVIGISDTIMDSSTDKRLRRCVYVQSELSKELDCWVEGVGSLTYGIIGRKRYNYESFKQLLECSQHHELLYAMYSTVGIKTPYVHTPSKRNKFFDLQGRPVKGTSKHGIYVRDGRKVIR